MRTYLFNCLVFNNRGKNETPSPFFCDNMLKILISIFILYIFISNFFSSLYNEEKVVTNYHDTDNQEVTKLKSTSNRHHNDIKHNNIQKH